MGKAVDRLIAAKWVKGKVDAAYKEAEIAAAEELDELRLTAGATEIAAMQLPGAGVYKYSTTRKKQVVEFNEADAEKFADWCDDNREAVMLYAIANSTAFAEWWFDQTGEVPRGIARVAYEEPAKVGPPKIYKFDADAVQSYFEERGGWLEGANRLMLGDGE